LADDPKAAFRAVSGLVLALFVTTVSVAVISTFVANRSSPKVGASTAGTLVKEFDLDFRRPGQQQVSPSDSMIAGLSSTPGVTGVLPVRTDPSVVPGKYWPRPGLVSCHDLARLPAWGSCPAAASVVTIAPDFDRASEAGVVWPAATVEPDQLARLPIRAVVVATDGTTQAQERARTLLEQADPGQDAPFTIGERNNENDSEILQYERLADVVILVTLLIAGCSLAVTVVGGLNERKRPFSLLRLTGVPLRVLRRVLELESAAPLLASAVVSIAAGFASAQLFLRSQLGYTVKPPGAGYYVMVVLGLLASLAIIASMFPLLDRSTGPEAARND
jgi:hypothetical protein